jgi:hypothetical protein
MIKKANWLKALSLSLKTSLKRRKNQFFPLFSVIVLSCHFVLPVYLYSCIFGTFTLRNSVCFCIKTNNQIFSFDVEHFNCRERAKYTTKVQLCLQFFPFCLNIYYLLKIPSVNLTFSYDWWPKGFCWANANIIKLKYYKLQCWAN